MTESVADAIMQTLSDSGVEWMFGFPGESSLPLYVPPREPRALTHVLARCQRCAGYMADAAARLTGSPAACDAPGGIGTPFMVPALHEAYNSSVPIVALTTATPSALEGRWPTSECDTASIYAPVVRSTVRIQDPGRTRELTRRAVELAVSGRPGPVHLEVPADLLTKPASAREDIERVALPSHRPSPDAAALAAMLGDLRRARRPVIVAGGGTHLSGASAGLVSFAERTGCPVATTLNGKGAIGEDHPLALGVLGAKGGALANAAAAEADFVLWIASKAGDKSTGFGDFPPPSATVWQVDIDPAELGRTLDARHIWADAAQLLEAATDPAAGPLREAWWLHLAATTSGAEGSGTPPIIRAIDAAYEGRAVVVADASRASSWVGAFYTVREPGRRVIAPRGSGSIGWALPATIAAALCRPDEMVVGVGGDAGFAMACHELETAVRTGARFVYAILDNNSLGLLNQVAGVSMGETGLLGHFAPTDWVAIARGFGCDAVRVDSADAFRRVLPRRGDLARPLIVDVSLSTTEESPDFTMFAQRHSRT